jgi:2-phosphosulfolactate phosphatase
MPRLKMTRITIALGEEGARDASLQGDVIIVVDSLRATTTILSALENGVARVIPARLVSECIGDLTAGESNGRKLPAVDLDNSPLSFLNRAFAGRVLTLRTTNGTRCLLAAKERFQTTVLVGALVNAKVVAQTASQIANRDSVNITIVASGRRGGPAEEDDLTANLIGYYINQYCQTNQQGFKIFDDYKDIFLNSDSGKHLAAIGAVNDVIFASRKNIISTVALFDSSACTACPETRVRMR